MQVLMRGRIRWRGRLLRRDRTPLQKKEIGEESWNSSDAHPRQKEPCQAEPIPQIHGSKEDRIPGARDLYAKEQVTKDFPRSSEDTLWLCRRPCFFCIELWHWNLALTTTADTISINVVPHAHPVSWEPPTPRRQIVPDRVLLDVETSYKASLSMAWCRRTWPFWIRRRVWRSSKYPTRRLPRLADACPSSSSRWSASRTRTSGTSTTTSTDKFLGSRRSGASGQTSAWLGGTWINSGCAELSLLSSVGNAYTSKIVWTGAYG